MNALYCSLLLLAFATVELLIGGTRLLFALPAYGILALAGVASLADLRRPKVPANGLCLVASAAFFGYVLVRTLTSPVESLAWFDRFMVLGGLLVYLITACLLTDPRRRLWVLGGLLVLAIVNLLVGARQFARGDGFMLFGFIRSTNYAGRASGLYICPDHFAGFLEVVGCLGLAVAFWSRARPWIKLLIGYVSCCAFAGVLLAASRGGFLSSIAGLTVLATLGIWRNAATSPGTVWRVIVLVAVLALVGGLVGGMVLRGSPMVQERARQLIDRRDVRLRLWPAAIKEFELSPWFGTGSATYLYYGRRFRDPTVQSDPIRSHNDYLELLAEYGAVGGLGLLTFLAAHFRWGCRAFRHFSLRYDSSGGGGGSNAAAWNIGALAAAACLMVHSVVDFNLHIPANTLLLAFVFGLLANPGRPLTPGEPLARLTIRDLVPRLALPALALWLGIEGLPKLPGQSLGEQARVALRDHHNVVALNLARRALAEENRDPMLFYYLGEARLQLSGLGPDTPIAHSFRVDALDAYRHAAALAPEDSTFLVKVAETEARLGNFEAADQAIAQARVWDPNSAMVETYTGFCLQSAGRRDEAAAAYRRANSLAANAASIQGLAEVSRPQVPAPTND